MNKEEDLAPLVREWEAAGLWRDQGEWKAGRTKKSCDAGLPSNVLVSDLRTLQQISRQFKGKIKKTRNHFFEKSCYFLQ